MARALVTGAGGFVGAALARRLLADGHDPVLVMRPGADRWRVRELRDACPIVEADVADRAAIDRTVADARPEWAIHLAAHGAYSWQRDAERMARVNVLGALHVAQAALRCGCAVVAAGSSSEYGFVDHAPSEDELPAPNSAYAATKASATLLFGQLAREHDAHLVTLRLYSAYGPWEEPGRLVPRLLVLGRDGRLPPLVDPQVARDYVHVDDVVDAILAAARRSDAPRGAVYNVGTGTQTTLAEVVAVVRDLLRITAEPEWGTMPNRGWDTATWIADPRRAQRELGWTARIALRDGLAQFSRWLAADPDRLRTYAATVGALDGR